MYLYCYTIVTPLEESLWHENTWETLSYKSESDVVAFTLQNHI